MSKLFFTSSIIKKEENKMARKEKIEKENLSEKQRGFHYDNNRRTEDKYDPVCGFRQV